ncbi:RNA recognition motif-containing protein [Mucilaginibacter gracilis]|uniref:RNA recognition motif-containing protein n=1 Tax=Mucilaginibacter gracilis TaxID=423350 RepID=A0A495ITV8_9SPHI|nr:RNA-binding protein [Mucilaginibacter gracilis]RKR80012.1 RNA recognition motif-containing protein [Mucilaginibacter gracilis]
MITKIFIGGFPITTEEIALAQLAGPHGNIVTLKLVRDKATGKSKGYAFMEMASREDAEQVIDALDGKAIGDKQLKVTICEEEPIKQAPIYQKVERPGAPTPVKKKRPRLSR